jgi:hypothetical protein
MYPLFIVKKLHTKNRAAHIIFNEIVMLFQLDTPCQISSLTVNASTEHPQAFVLSYFLTSRQRDNVIREIGSPPPSTGQPASNASVSIPVELSSAMDYAAQFHLHRDEFNIFFLYVGWLIPTAQRTKTQVLINE